MVPHCPPLFLIRAHPDEKDLGMLQTGWLVLPCVIPLASSQVISVPTATIIANIAAIQALLTMPLFKAMCLL